MGEFSSVPVSPWHGPFKKLCLKMYESFPEIIFQYNKYLHTSKSYEIEIQFTIITFLQETFPFYWRQGTCTSLNASEMDFFTFLAASKKSVSFQTKDETTLLRKFSKVNIHNGSHSLVN